MRKGQQLLGFGMCLVGASMLLSQGAQALDGSYRGVYDNEPVTASFDDLESSVTGMLSIGGQRYLLQADGIGNGYAGQLHNLVSGQVLSVELTMKENRVQVHVEGGATPMLFELEKTTK